MGMLRKIYNLLKERLGEDGGIQVDVELTNIESDLSTIKADLADVKTDLAAMKSDLADIKDYVDGVEAKLDSMITLLTQIEANTSPPG